MKQIILIIIFLLSQNLKAQQFPFLFWESPDNPLSAQTYYVDASAGNDANDGRSTSTAWQTISKVQAHTFVPGDTIRFKGGQTFTGLLEKIFSDSSTTNIVFNSYSTGKAIIKPPAGTEVSTWRFYVPTNYVQSFVVDSLIFDGNYNVDTRAGDTLGYTSGISFLYGEKGTSTDPSYVKVTNCEIRNYRSVGLTLQNGDFLRRINIDFTNNYIHDIGKSGIVIYYVWYSTINIIYNQVSKITGYPVNLTDSFYYGGIGIDLGLCKGTKANPIVVERNLIYDLGKYSSGSGLGFICTASKNVRLRYNEIYGVVNRNQVPAHPIHDAEAIDFESGSDSCIAEYNYIHNVDGVGVLLSGQLSGAGYRLYENYPGWANMDSTTGCDYNIIRYNILKDCARYYYIMSISIATGFEGAVAHNNYVYNNTIVARKSFIAIDLRGTQDSTRIFNNIILTDSTDYAVRGNSAEQTNLIMKNNCYWEKSGNSIYGKVWWDEIHSMSINAWSNYSGQEKTAGVKTFHNYNPFLKDPWTVRDTINNVDELDTLTAYLPVHATIMKDNGLDLNSLYGSDVGLVDFIGYSLPVGSGYDIGACEANN